MCVNVCDCGRWVTELEEAPHPSEQSSSTSWNMECTGLCYRRVTVEGVEVFFFSLQNKKLTPCWVSLQGVCSSSLLPLPLRPLGDAQPALHPSSPPPFHHPYLPPVSPHFPPSEVRVNCRSDLLLWSLSPKTLLFSPFCHLPFVRVFSSFLPLYPLSSLAVSRPPPWPQPVISLLSSVASTLFFLELLGKHYLFFPFPLRPFLFSAVFSPSKTAKPFGARSGLWEDPGGWLLYEATSLNK